MKDAFSSFSNIQPIQNRDRFTFSREDVVQDILAKIRPLIEDHVDKIESTQVDEIKKASDSLKAELEKGLSEGKVADIAKRLDDAISDIGKFGGDVSHEIVRLEKRIIAEREALKKSQEMGSAEVDKLYGTVRRIDLDMRRAFKKINEAQKALKEKAPDNTVSKDIDKLKTDVFEFRAMIRDMQDGGASLDGVVADISARMDAFSNIYELIARFDGKAADLEKKVVKRLEDMRPTYVPQLQRGADGSSWYDGSTDPEQGLGVNNDYYFKTDGEFFKKIDGSWVSRGSLNVDSLPDQSGNSGRYLTTNGTTASWAALAGGGDMAAATYDPAGKSEQVLTTGDIGDIRVKIDITGGGGTFGTLGGAVNGANQVFTVSAGEYVSGTLEVYWQGQWQPQDGNGFSETTPASGTFTMDLAPESGTKVAARYCIAL